MNLPNITKQKIYCALYQIFLFLFFRLMVHKSKNFTKYQNKYHKLKVLTINLEALE